MKLENSEIEQIANKIEQELWIFYHDNARVVLGKDDYTAWLNYENEPNLYKKMKRILKRDYPNLCEESIQKLNKEVCIPSLLETFRERITKEL